MVDRILDQWLDSQARYQGTHRQISNVPADLQAVPEAELLYALIDCRYFEFLFKRSPFLLRSQVRSQQIGEVLDSVAEASSSPAKRQAIEGIKRKLALAAARIDPQGEARQTLLRAYLAALTEKDPARAKELGKELGTSLATTFFRRLSSFGPSVLYCKRTSRRFFNSSIPDVKFT